MGIPQPLKQEDLIKEMESYMKSVGFEFQEVKREKPPKKWYQFWK